MRKLLTIFGGGIITGTACRIGSMLADAMFPNGLSDVVSKFKKKPENEQNQSEPENYKPIRGKG